jgi:hypothetical protein
VNSSVGSTKHDIGTPEPRRGEVGEKGKGPTAREDSESVGRWWESRRKRRDPIWSMASVLVVVSVDAMEGQGDIPQSGARYSARNEFKRHRARREREREILGS